MAKQTRSLVYELTSVNAAVGVDAAPFKVTGEAVTVQIMDAPANLGRVQISMDGINFVNATYDAPGGVAAINNVGAGIYLLLEKPHWIRFGVNQDGAAPQIYRAMFQVHEQD